MVPVLPAFDVKIFKWLLLLLFVLFPVHVITD